MEIETNGNITFLDVLVYKKLSRSHSIPKTTHTDRYLNKSSNHHSNRKRAIMKTLIERAIRICEPDSVNKEFSPLRHALQANGYSLSEINHAMHVEVIYKPTSQ